MHCLLFFLQYHGSFSLRHWLQQSDWLPTLEATLALDEDSVRRVGDDTVGGPEISRQLRLIRILMRDLLIGVSVFLLVISECKVSTAQLMNLWHLPGLFSSGELLTQPWTCPYRVETGECAYKPSR